MASLSSCPGCPRTLKKSLLGGAYFPVYTCFTCKKKYCSECSGPGGRCPKGCTGGYGHFDDVYAR